MLTYSNNRERSFSRRLLGVTIRHIPHIRHGGAGDLVEKGTRLAEGRVYRESVRRMYDLYDLFIM